ncbi:MAG TPA: AraC family transcriptional regulator, partial [Armatimonadota bacterium]|nr:AraC family transcriptional regulator [Armatimonadota bacterium]
VYRLTDAGGNAAPAQPVGPGTVIYHPPHRPHAWHAVGTQCCEVLHLQFDVRPAVPLRHPACWPVWPDFFTDTQLLFGEIEEQSPNWSDRFALRLAVIFSRVLSLIEAPDSDAPERAATLRHLAALEEYLQAHLAQPLTLDMIAQHLCISRRTLTRLVRQQTNGSVMDRLRTLRMTRAATLLWQTELSLQEIAEQVGIPQLSNFCRCFRRCYHYSPARYRRQMLKTRASALNLYSFLGRTAIPAKE